MTEAEQTVLLIKGTVSELNPEQLKKFQVATEEIRKIIDKGTFGVLALAFVGAELQLQIERDSRSTSSTKHL